LKNQSSSELDTVIKEVLKFRDNRDWLQFHNPKSLSAAISIEAAELQEIFLWQTTEESYNLTPKQIKEVSEELADIFIFMTYLSNHFKIDLLDAVKTKIETNRRKYPADKTRGSSKKYSEY